MIKGLIKGIAYRQPIYMSFLIRLKCCTFCLLALTLTTGYSRTSNKNHPNIILIIADDVNWDDLGCYGNEKIKTPNLDKVANEGIRFDNVYLVASSCSPSRTSILTGRYPHNTGAAELHTALPKHLVYFPEKLKERGYYTALAGKFHEGPSTRRAYDRMEVDSKKNGEGGEEQWLNVLSERPTDKPFFFWFSAYDAHRPWSVKTVGSQHDPLKDIKVPDNLWNDEPTRNDLKMYYNEIGRLDYYVGQLNDALKKEGIADNTIIIFISDNGRPFPGSKTRLYDTGLKTPMLIKWPLKIKEKQFSPSLISTIDIAPTILNIVGIPAPVTFQGVSFLSLLTSPKEPFRKYVFGEHNWHDYEAYERSVRTKDYLYIINERPFFNQWWSNRCEPKSGG